MRTSDFQTAIKHLRKNKKFAKPFLPVHMGPRSNLLSQKRSKISWHCPTNWGQIIFDKYMVLFLRNPNPNLKSTGPDIIRSLWFSRKMAFLQKYHLPRPSCTRSSGWWWWPAWGAPSPSGSSGTSSTVTSSIPTNLVRTLNPVFDQTVSTMSKLYILLKKHASLLTIVD